MIAQIKIDGFECVEDMAQAVLSWTYKGKTIKEWADSISEPKTNADRIRSMSDEELANILDGSICPPGYNEIGACEADEQICKSCWLEWLKQEAT